ncbi:MAG: Ppx/GppA phosphatase family protein [Pseudomonadota bacterium]
MTAFRLIPDAKHQLRALSERVGSASEPDPVGVVDIGSNSVRLIVYHGATRAPTPIFNEKVLCGLGRGVSSTGLLGEEPIARAVAALTRFRAVARTLGVGYLQAVATAAVREADDGPEFVEKAEAALGCAIEILSGEREAALAAQGILLGFRDPDGMAGDLGGGSLELIRIKGRELSNAASLPIGVLRLADVSGNKISKAVNIVRDELAELGWLGKGKTKRFFAVGGTWRAIAKLHMAQTDYPLFVMQHYAIAADEMIALCQRIRRTTNLDDMPGLDAVPRARREGLPFGALSLEMTLRAARAEEVVFSVFGIREGLLYALLSERERLRDPLICFCEDYAVARARSPAYGYELFAWTTPLFKALKDKESPEQARLRLAACLLNDIGWRAHPDYRGEQSLSVVAHAALSGIDHPGRLFLALASYFRYAGANGEGGGALAGRLREMAGPDAVHRARVLAAAIRAAHMLSCARAGVIDETPITCRGGMLTLKLPEQHAALDGERVRRRFQSLAQIIDHEFAVA